MIYAIGLKMKPGCGNSGSLLEIDQIYLHGNGISDYYEKDMVHDFVKQFPGSIKVAIQPFPDIIPEVSCWSGEKYVRSEPDEFSCDNLLNLPKC